MSLFSSNLSATEILDRKRRNKLYEVAHCTSLFAKYVGRLPQFELLTSPTSIELYAEISMNLLPPNKCIANYFFNQNYSSCFLLSRITIIHNELEAN